MPTVQDILAKKGAAVCTITRNDTVLEAARKMNAQRIGAVCVVEGEELVGVFTERDVLNRVVAQQLDPAATRIADVMSAPVITCVPSAKLADCTLAMSSKKLRHLPVVEADGSSKLVGILSTGDIMALEADQKQAHIEHLHEYLHGRV